MSPARPANSDVEPLIVAVQMNTEADSGQEQAADAALDQFDQTTTLGNIGCEQSPTSDINTTPYTQRQNSPSVAFPSTGRTWVNNVPQTSNEKLSTQRIRVNGSPVSVSLSKPLSNYTSLLKDRIQWYGNWRLGWEPRWGPIQPQIEGIRKVAKPFLPQCGIDPHNFKVDTFQQGMWNKIFLISSTNKQTGAITERIFRIPLPVNPWFKMQSEVATMEYVRTTTKIPVPKIFFFESSMENALGFEWMIMEKMNGRTFRDAEDSISQQANLHLHKTIAEWVHQFSMLEFNQIGSLYREWDPRSDKYLDFSLGPVTSDCFLGPWRIEREVFRGPFRNEAEFYRAVIELNLEDVLDHRQQERARLALAKDDGIEPISKQNSRNEDVGDGTIEDDFSSKGSSLELIPKQSNINEDVANVTIEDDFSSKQSSFSIISNSETANTVYPSMEAFEPSGVRKTCFSLFSVLPLLEDRLLKGQRKYILHHFDISKDNVLVNDVGEAIALLDWENMTTVSPSQIYPWPSIMDPTGHEAPEPWQGEGPKPAWYLAAERDYNSSLAADLFMSRLAQLNSSWPQAKEGKQNFKNEFEQDLNELGSLVRIIHAGWAEMDICEKIKKYYEMFQPIPPVSVRSTLMRKLRMLRNADRQKIFPIWRAGISKRTSMF